MEKFILDIAEIFDEVTPSVLDGKTKFRELEIWDSIMALSVIGMIDEEYGVVFNAEDMRVCATIEDLYNRINAKK